MKINLDASRESMAHHLVFNSVEFETIDEITKAEGYNPREVEIELLVNGVKCDIFGFVEALEESFNRESKRLEDTRQMTRDALLEDFKADKNTELEKELDDIMDSLYNFKNRADEIIDKLYK